MNAAEKDLEALRDKVAELELRVKELTQENRELRDICEESGIRYEERLALRRHRKYFATLLGEHPPGRRATASDLLGAAPIVRGIATCAGRAGRAVREARAADSPIRQSR